MANKVLFKMISRMHAATRTKLPSGWKQWVVSMGGYPFGGDKRKTSDYYYFVINGYHFRITCNGTLQIGDSVEEFARWALCDTIEVDKPTTKDSFVKTIDKLLGEKL